MVTSRLAVYVGTKENNASKNKVQTYQNVVIVENPDISIKTVGR